MQHQSLRYRFGRALRMFFARLFYDTSNPTVRGRNHRHLENEYRRQLSSPIAAAALVAKLIFNNNDIRAVLRQNPMDQPQLMRVAVIGDEIRINLYRLERFPGGPLTRAFNPNWIQDGVIDFLVTAKVSARSHTSDLTVWTQEYQHVIRPDQLDLSYDYYEPCASLVLSLNIEELDQIACVTQVQQRWPAAGRLMS